MITACVFRILFPTSADCKTAFRNILTLDNVENTVLWLLQLMKVLTAAHEHALHREYQAAAQSLSKAAALLPMDTDVHLCLAGMLWEAGKNLEAVSLAAVITECIMSRTQ